jgi:aminopeptidase N
MKSILSFIFIIFCAQFANSQLLDDVTYCLEGKGNFYKKAEKLGKLNAVKFPGDSRIDVNYYKLNLNFDVSYEYTAAAPLVVNYLNKKLNGIATIKAKATQADVDSIDIDLQNSLTVDSVFVNNVKTTFRRLPAIIRIYMQKKYTTNEQFNLNIYYQGTPGSSGFGSFTFGFHAVAGTKQEPAIWSLSEPFGASDWFPCKDNPADKADSSEVWITAPKYFTSVSNGVLLEKIENATTNTFKWKSCYPIANYLISIALANYDYYRNDFIYNTTSAMKVEHYIYPEYNTPATKVLMDDTNFMLALFTEKFGPYPFINEKYGHAQFGWGGGMEHQTCSSMVNLSSGLTAHELAHQWFGDKITCQDWANIWLNEGFATYGALLYWEAKRGRADYDTKVIATMNGAKTAVGTIYVQNPTTVGNIFNGARSYSKAGIVLHMLRNIVGDNTFFNIIRSYTSSIHAYGNATTENFQAIVENVTGQDFDYFFNQWIYGEKYPKYQFGWTDYLSSGAKQNAGAANYTLKFKITQLINTPAPSYFTMPVDVKVTFEDNTTEIIRVLNNAQDQLFEFNFPKNITEVIFDPNNGILKDLTLVQLNIPLSLEEEKVKILENEAFAKEISFQFTPNPANEKLKVEFQLIKAEPVNIQIIDLNGRIITTLEIRKPLGKQQHLIETVHIPNGIYILNLLIDNKKISRKINIIH